MSDKIGTASESAVGPEEIARLREIEHMAWHVMDDSAEHPDGAVILDGLSEDFRKLIELLPEGHPEYEISVPQVSGQTASVESSRLDARNGAQPAAAEIVARSAKTLGETPRTDAEHKRRVETPGDWVNHFSGMADFARQIERELADLAKEHAKLLVSRINLDESEHGPSRDISAPSPLTRPPIAAIPISAAKPEEGLIVNVFLNASHMTMPNCWTVAYWDGVWRSPEHHMPMSGADHITHWHMLPAAPSQSSQLPLRDGVIDECIKLIDKKGQALTNEYCHGDAGPDGYTWTNKEAEWQVILLGELMDEFRALKTIAPSATPLPPEGKS